MVNKTFLPPFPHSFQIPKPLKQHDFPSWHGFRSERGEPVRFGRADAVRFGVGASCLGERGADRTRGEPPMENALLVGLSRQTTLERHLSVVANNLANVNTNGYKADQMLFEEYLNSNAHEDNFSGRD